MDLGQLTITDRLVFLWAASWMVPFGAFMCFLGVLLFIKVFSGE